jgi:hypothetical protein
MSKLPLTENIIIVMVLVKSKLSLLETPLSMLSEVKLSVNTSPTPMVNQSEPHHSEPVETTDFKLLIHSPQSGLPNSDIHRLPEEEDQDQDQVQDQVLDGLLDQVTSHVWAVSLEDQAAEVVSSLESATMASKSRMLQENLPVLESDLAQESNQLPHYPKSAKVWSGEVFHHPMEVTTSIQEPAGIDLFEIQTYIYHHLLF